MNLLANRSRHTSVTLAVGAAGVALSAGLGAAAAFAPKFGPLIAGGIFGLMLLMTPSFMFIMAVGLLPFIVGVNVGGLTITVTDLGMMVTLAGFFLTRKERLANAIKLIGPAWWVIYGVSLYLGIAIVEGFLIGKTGAVLLTVVRRVLIVVLPLMAGVCLGLHRKMFDRALLAFVAGCCILAIVWIAHFSEPGVLGVNKNPGGQAMANAALLLLLHRKLRPWQLGAIGLLCVGILATGSRGSLIGLGIGFIVLMLVRYAEALTWKRLVAMVGVVIIALFAAPSSVTERLFSENESGQYNADIRNVFVADALAQSANALALGHGIGTYKQVDPALSRVESNDPHNVFVLQIFEGGILLLVAFLVMSLTPVLVLWKYRRDHLVLAALALHISLLIHCYVDIYWVRGTPTLSWLLIGAALIRVSALRRDSSSDGTTATPEALSTPPAAAPGTATRKGQLV